MAIADVLRAMNALKRSGAIRDYLVFGSVAAMLYTRPFATEDVDIGIAVASDAEYRRAFQALARFGTVRGFSVVINDTPVEVFPVDISPIIHDALAHAPRKRVAGALVKVAPPEHLLLEALRVYRRADKARVFLLAGVVPRARLRAALRRLDHDGTLRRRYEELVGKAP